MKKVVLATFAGGCLLASAATGFAQSTTTIVETTGAAPPDEVVTYVQRERAPSVRVEGDVRIGYALPSSVELRTIPSHKEYSYAVVNDRRVIVEPSSRKVIRVIE